MACVEDSLPFHVCKDSLAQASRRGEARPVRNSPGVALWTEWDESGSRCCLSAHPSCHCSSLYGPCCNKTPLPHRSLAPGWHTPASTPPSRSGTAPSVKPFLALPGRGGRFFPGTSAARDTVPFELWLCLACCLNDVHLRPWHLASCHTHSRCSSSAS